MGLLDLLRPNRPSTRATRSALAEAGAPQSLSHGAVSGLIQRILEIGIDGKGPYDSAAEVAEKALKASDGDVERAISRVIASHQRVVAAGGFVTGLGGFVTMPVALPANLFEFYVNATRMVGAVASLRGYDLTSPQIRTAVLLTLVGSRAHEILTNAGVALAMPGGRLAGLALSRLPASAIMVINKAVGFRLLKGLAQKTLSRFGRAIPLAGGVIGGGLDWWMLRRIARQAKHEFPRA
ncbi:MAG TPA: EcsC family protein [Propionibacteriaceae bacterium]|nr:EcsC family protein [Propionibacteriaceae bacterium]HQE30854.1 EcsC family protein [Propionibacteriaceae bacterium]